MSLDSGQKIVGAEMRRALVEAIRDADNSVSEKLWVEWKTHVDLTAKQWHAEMAKQVVGFANRLPDAAEQHAGGHAYLVLGVEPGLIDGVIPVEDLQLVRDLRPYLGQSGPLWDSAYIKIEDKHVLLVEVMPPKWGDPVFQIRKELGGVREGPYVRRAGETAIASAVELDQLVERARRSALRVAVGVVWAEGEPSIDPIELTEAAFDRWVKKERARLDPPRPAVAGGILGEVRSRQKFERDLYDYLGKARKLIPRKADIQAMLAKAGAVRLKVINLTERHLKDVRVEVELPAETRGGLDPRDEQLLLEFPKAPETWGTGSSILADLVTPIFARNWAPPPPLGWVDSTRRVVTFAEKDIFAEDWIVLPTLHIIVGDTLGGQRLELHWSARSSSADGVARGSLEFNVSTRVRQFDQLMSFRSRFGREDATTGADVAEE